MSDQTDPNTPGNECTETIRTRLSDIWDCRMYGIHNPGDDDVCRDCGSVVDRNSLGWSMRRTDPGSDEGKQG